MSDNQYNREEIQPLMSYWKISLKPREIIKNERIVAAAILNFIFLLINFTILEVPNSIGLNQQKTYFTVIYEE